MLVVGEPSSKEKKRKSCCFSYCYAERKITASFSLCRPKNMLVFCSGFYCFLSFSYPPPILKREKRMISLLELYIYTSADATDRFLSLPPPPKQFLDFPSFGVKDCESINQQRQKVLRLNDYQ